MLAYNLTQAQAEAAAARAGVRIIEWRASCGRSVRFRLGLSELPDATLYQHLNGVKPWQRRSAHAHLRSGRTTRLRKVAAVCWHGHRTFFRALFAVAPDARVQTALMRRAGQATFGGHGARFYTAENFKATYESTDVNIGSQAYPCYASEACYCGE